MVIGRDMNDHVTESKAGYERNDGSTSSGIRIEIGETLLSITQVFDLSLVNIFLPGKDECLITHKSKGKKKNSQQISANEKRPIEVSE